MGKIKLFCLPYAGGSAATYMGWKRHLNENIELKPVELAGKGKRISQPLYRSMEEAVSDVYDRIMDDLDGSPYALYGHSMGTIVAYELLRKIINNGLKEPVHAFFSGRFPPFIESDKEKDYLLPDKDFIAKIYKLGGTTQEVLSNKELLDIFLPVLRADYMIVENYNHDKDILKLNCDISILNGKHDEYVKDKDLAAWQKCTNKSCSFYEFDDGHFFINKYKEDISKIINNALL